MDRSAEIVIRLRLGAAGMVGAAIGLNRDLHGKPTGVRTLGLDANPVSRAIRGVLTGIGFLGAGVIVRESTGEQVHGLTTAALIWLTACLGIVCGLGAWTGALVALVFVFALLAGGGPLERWLHRKWVRASTGKGPSGQENADGS